MLKDERAKDGLRDFHLQWLGIYGVDELEKDDDLQDLLARGGQGDAGRDRRPSSTPPCSGRRRPASSRRCSPRAPRSSTGRWPSTTASPGSPATTCRRSTSTRPQRAGILTQGSFLAKHSKEVDSFPIARGVHVLRQVLCQEIPEPQHRAAAGARADAGRDHPQAVRGLHRGGGLPGLPRPDQRRRLRLRELRRRRRLPRQGRGPDGRRQRHAGAALGHAQLQERRRVRQGASPRRPRCATAWPATGCARCCGGRSGPTRAARSRPSTRRSPSRTTTCGRCWSA